MRAKRDPSPCGTAVQSEGFEAQDAAEATHTHHALGCNANARNHANQTSHSQCSTKCRTVRTKDGSRHLNTKRHAHPERQHKWATEPKDPVTTPIMANLGKQAAAVFLRICPPSKSNSARHKVQLRLKMRAARGFARQSRDSTATVFKGLTNCDVKPALKQP